MGNDASSQSGQSPKVLIVTALISMIGTILVAFVGIVPQLRNKDADQITKLSDRVNQLLAEQSKAPPASEKQISIFGTVKAEDGSKVLAGYEVYLVPSNNDLYTSKTDDAGRFTLAGLPDGTYSIMVRDSTNGLAGRGLLLDDNDSEVKVIGALIKYRIQK